LCQPSDSIDRREEKDVEEGEEDSGGCLDILLKDEAKDARGFCRFTGDLISSSSSPPSQLSA
jgi:hypothetical protein